MQIRHKFSFVECGIIILIIVVFAIIALPRVMKGATIAMTNACKTNVMVMNLQMELYYQNEGKWPADFNSLSNNHDYFPDGIPKCPFGEPYTMHSSKHWINQHRH